MRDSIKDRLLRLERWTPKEMPAEQVKTMAALDALLADRGFDPDCVPPGGMFNAIVQVLDDVAAEIWDGRLPASTAAILSQLAPERRQALQ